MGLSKIIMLSGVYLIFLLYNIAFNNADESMFKTSMQIASLTQSEQLSETGLSLALAYMANDSSQVSFAERTFVMENDTVRYSASQPAGFPASQTQVISVASHTSLVDGSVEMTRTVTQTAVYQFHNGRWKQMSVYTSRDIPITF